MHAMGRVCGVGEGEVDGGLRLLTMVDCGLAGVPEEGWRGGGSPGEIYDLRFMIYDFGEGKQGGR